MNEIFEKQNKVIQEEMRKMLEREENDKKLRKAFLDYIKAVVDENGFADERRRDLFEVIYDLYKEESDPELEVVMNEEFEIKRAMEDTALTDLLEDKEFFSEVYEIYTEVKDSRKETLLYEALKSFCESCADILFDDFHELELEPKPTMEELMR